VKVRAIDVHVHPSTKEYMVDTMGEYGHQHEEYFKVEIPVRTDQQFVAEYRDLDLKAVVFAFDTETRTGRPATSNDYVARLCRDNPDTFTGFCSVDPWKRELAVDEVERSVTELGLIGLKLHPGFQGFYPNQRDFYPLWEKCQELGIAVLFHSGFMAAGAGRPGGMGFYLDHVRPIYLDFVAADFPELTIIMAHPSWPWQDEAIAIALHKQNVFMDLSGWLPRYFPEQLKYEINRRLQDKVMFGSDYPFVAPDRWITGIDDIELRPGIREKILYGNALRILPVPWEE
jgi:predicted TIM-barrel fold metal-dependent hydrolase